MKTRVTSHPAFLLARALLFGIYHKDKEKRSEADAYFHEIKFHYGEDKLFISEAMKAINEL